MGCNSSRNIQVQPVAKTPRAGPRAQVESATKSPKRTCSLGSLADGSIRSNSSERGRSATSKVSKHSTADSGLGEADFPDEYANVVTEYSEDMMIKAVEDSFDDPGDELDLGITGMQCQRRQSAKDKERLEEQRILASLREEGLIARPKSRAAGGLSFEVIMEGPGLNPLSRPPARLAKLERRKKKKKDLTEDEIKAKLERAEERRKKHEQERLEKISAQTHKSDINSALESFAQSQKTKEESVKTDLDAHQENRQKRLQELREKLKAKSDHAEMVRRRKKLAPIVPHPESELAQES